MNLNYSRFFKINLYLRNIIEMNKYVVYMLFFMIAVKGFSQDEKKNQFSLEADYFYGNIYEHNPDISHLIKGHPTGLFLMFNKKTFGLKEWEKKYNYPDWGLSLSYQNFKNTVLGNNYSLYGHYSFYFLKRNLQLSLGTGLAYNTNPYNENSNFSNNAYGSKILSSSFIKINYIKENSWNGFGFQAGILFLHYSNGNVKAPNTSTNSLLLNVGVNYQLDYKSTPTYHTEKDSVNYSERVKFNLVYRFGWNQSDVIGSDTYPLYVFSAFADKRLNYYNTLQLGADVFISKYLEEFIKYRAIAYPEFELSGDEDYKRVGIFVGHELRINRTAISSQIGYYAYFPYEFSERIYLRFGLKRYLYKDKLFAVISLKSHFAQAEAIEFGFGLRL